MAARQTRSSPGPDPGPARRDGPPLLPAVRGERWFDPDGRPFTLRVEIPLGFDEMVAALYGVAEPGEITTAEAVTGCVAVTLALEGLPALAERAARIRHAEQRGTIESPQFLALCRQRVAALLAP